MRRPVILFVITLLSAVVIYAVLSPRYGRPVQTSRDPATPVSSSSVPGDSPGSATRSLPSNDVPPSPAFPAVSPDVNTAPRVEIPKSDRERSDDSRESMRAPFYRWIRENMSDVLIGWQPASKDPATLELYAARDDADLERRLLAAVVQPYAVRYGFNHVLFFVPNSAESASHYRVDAEAQYDNGVWQMFRK